jgi:hypothetical protein
MKILVVAAMPIELKAIKQWIKSANLKMNLDIDFLCCWIWNYEAISSLQHYLTENKEEVFIRNIWVCWYWNKDNEVKNDPIQVASVININNEKEFIIPPFLQLAPLKNCYCSENVISQLPKLNKDIWEFEEMYFDMECWWIEFIASKYKYPRLILKVPFDIIWEDNDVREKDYKLLSERIWNLLSNLDYHKYINSIIEWISKQTWKN